MATDLRTLYEKYVDYATSLRADFDRHVGKRVPEKYRPRLLGFDDFCEMWRYWGSVESLHQTWEHRFAVGYDCVARALSDQLQASLTPEGDGCGGSLSRAA